MNNDIYSQVFMSLGIPIHPLPSNYSPEEFGRRLFSMSHTECGVSYAASTDYLELPPIASEIITNKGYNS